MKKITSSFLLYVISFCLLLVFFSCKKSSNTTTTPPAPNNFTWTYNANTYTASLDTAYQFSIALAPYCIIAINGTNFNTSFTRKIMFRLSSFSTGSFTIGTGNNYLDYIDDAGNDLFGTSGSLNITSNANNRLTGNFSCTMSGSPGTYTVTGSFTNVPVRP